MEHSVHGGGEGSPGLEQFNEADVREEIIAPLIRELGYRSGTSSHVLREQPLQLRYSHLSLGRKKPSDPELRGKADYILQVDGRLNWVIEAKAPVQDISIDDVEQAYTYACHPEVRAVYFAVCNGHWFHLYRTSSSPDTEPLLKLSYAEIEDKLEQLRGIVGPDALRRDFRDLEPDYGLPLGPGLRSLARVTGGLVDSFRSSINSPALGEMQTFVRSGSIERNEDGIMVATLNTHASLRSIQELNERMGISTYDLTSRAGTLSCNPDNPTTFDYERRVIFPAGECLFDLATWSKVELPCNLTLDVEAVAECYLDRQCLLGTFRLQLRCADMDLDQWVAGRLNIQLA